MKTGTKFLRVLAVAAAVALPSHALADGHDKPGFYIGGGGHLNNASFDSTKAFGSSDKVTLSFTGAAGTSGNANPFNRFSQQVGPIVSTLSLTADDKSAIGFGVHGGYRFNRHFALEGSYAILGEFTSNYSIRLPNTTLTTGGGTAANDIVLDAARNTRPLTGKYTAEATAISGAVLGMYPLADNATAFGRLGYYAMSVDESLTVVAFNATDDGGDPDADNEGALTGGNASLNQEIAGDTNGFIFGGGFEMKFGRQQNILVRAEFELLSDAVAEEETLARFGLTGSYSF